MGEKRDVRRPDDVPVISVRLLELARVHLPGRRDRRSGARRHRNGPRDQHESGASLRLFLGDSFGGRQHQAHDRLGLPERLLQRWQFDQRRRLFRT